MENWITSPAGEKYVALSGDRTSVLARVRGTSTLYLELDLLGKPDSHTGLLLVRPGHPGSDSYRALYLTPAGLLVGLHDENECYAIYDTRGRRRLDGREVIGLSPFLLHDERTTIHRPDESRILEPYSRGYPVSRPRLESLQRQLGHVNPAVRASAARLLGVMALATYGKRILGQN